MHDGIHQLYGKHQNQRLYKTRMGPSQLFLLYPKFSRTAQCIADQASAIPPEKEALGLLQLSQKGPLANVKRKKLMKEFGFQSKPKSKRKFEMD